MKCDAINAALGVYNVRFLKQHCVYAQLSQYSIDRQYSIRIP